MNSTKKVQATSKAHKKSKNEIALEAELARLKDIAARAQADLQNAKERMERDARDIRAFAAAGIISNLLPTLDNFQRAFQHLPEDLKDHEWVKGVQAMELELLKKLQDAGLRKIECQGQVINSDKHEVLQVGPGEQDTITQVFEDGYEFNGKVLRPAKVMAGDGTEAVIC